MGWEYQLNYLSPKWLSKADLNTLQEHLTKAAHVVVKFELINETDAGVEYGLKLTDIAAHDWIWDGKLYLNSHNGQLVFNTGTNAHRDLVKQFLENIFSAHVAEIKLEEL
jgi:uncharacterized protein YihD (DUF1040 family)